VTARVLVTVRCPRKGHVLAELAAGGDGRRVLRMRHHAVLFIAEDGSAAQQHLPPGTPSGGGLWHSHDWETRAASYPVTCACRRPCLVVTADIEAADTAGKSTVVAGPMR
jgi:hypothetical protein